MLLIIIAGRGLRCLWLYTNAVSGRPRHQIDSLDATCVGQIVPELTLADLPLTPYCEDLQVTQALQPELPAHESATFTTLDCARETRTIPTRAT